MPHFSSAISPPPPHPHPLPSQTTFPKDHDNIHRAAAGGDPAKRAQAEADPTRGMTDINPAPTASVFSAENLNQREDAEQQCGRENGSSTVGRYANTAGDSSLPGPGHRRRGSTGSSVPLASVEVVIRAEKQDDDVGVLKEELNGGFVGGAGGHQHRGRSGPADARGHRRRGSTSNALVSTGTNRLG